MFLAFDLNIVAFESKNERTKKIPKRCTENQNTITFTFYACDNRGKLCDVWEVICGIESSVSN